MNILLIKLVFTDHLFLLCIPLNRLAFLAQESLTEKEEVSLRYIWKFPKYHSITLNIEGGMGEMLPDMIQKSIILITKLQRAFSFSVRVSWVGRARHFVGV